MSRITVNLPNDLLIQVQHHAAQTGRSFDQLIADVLRDELQRPAQLPHLPVFEGDGLRPGVDLTNYGSLLDLMEDP